MPLHGGIGLAVYAGFGFRPLYDHGDRIGTWFLDALADSLARYAYAPLARAHSLDLPAPRDPCANERAGEAREVSSTAQARAAAASAALARDQSLALLVVAALTVCLYQSSSLILALYWEFTAQAGGS